MVKSLIFCPNFLSLCILSYARIFSYLVIKKEANDLTQQSIAPSKHVSLNISDGI